MPPIIGSYATQRKVYPVSTLDGSSQEVVVTFPSNGTSQEKFPLISYAHGMFGGGTDILGYVDLFHQLASYGFVVAAHKSCSNGCLHPGGASKYTNCAGLLNVEPFNKGWDSYYGESLKTIEWARNSGSNVTLPINWTTGVGIAGHSMGGQSTTIAASSKCSQEYDIRAGVIHHPANGELSHGQFGNIGENVSIPMAAFTSSGDGIWNETYGIWNAMNGTSINKIYRDVKGFSHLEPVLSPPIENPYLATYTAAWFAIYLKGEKNANDESFQLIYGNRSDSICNYSEMVKCIIGRAPQNEKGEMDR